MTFLEKLLEGNKRFQETYLKYAKKIPSKPRKKLAILTCTDTRLNPIRIFHINIGDSVILRNAGNQVTDDVIRSLMIAISGGITEIIILGHTDCSMTKFSPINLTLAIQELGGSLDLSSLIISNEMLRTFSNERINVRDQVNKLRSYSLIPSNIPIHGLLFDVGNGTLKIIVNGYDQLTKIKPPSKGLNLNMPTLKMPIVTMGNIFTSYKNVKKSLLKK